MNSDTPLPILAGPTASGKTHFALLLAERHGMEIVSADSRQIYRGLDIGTAKPTPEEQARARHHVIDVCDPTETYCLARFIADAEAAIADIRARGKRPLLVGGTGLYLRGLTQGIFEDDSHDPEVRRRIRSRIEVEGAPAVHVELARADPVAAAKIHPNDAVRIARALEVLEVTGEPISWLWTQSRSDGPRHAHRIAVIDVERGVLSERIDRRTRAMFEGGLLDEVAALLRSGVSPGAPGMRAIGYPQAIAAIRGEMTREEAIDVTARETRRYAKRQRTWFRSERGAVWLDPSRRGDAKFLAQLEKTLAIHTV
ncbi:tRNA (adenosine(37)-N6)-dimethylallyltransferase MiaA [Candidatus Sumerlaeota bacterium]|nr:tRNA (adenosine(37)-N6)-dimethylallyltransferase MiaA [Candidatus Sumerlaeota bacterium]